MAAGPRALEERCRPLFGALSSAYLWLGEDQAQANIFKILLNFALLGLVEVVAENDDSEVFRTAVRRLIGAGVSRL